MTSQILIPPRNQPDNLNGETQGIARGPKEQAWSPPSRSLALEPAQSAYIMHQHRAFSPSAPPGPRPPIRGSKKNFRHPQKQMVTIGLEPMTAALLSLKLTSN